MCAIEEVIMATKNIQIVINPPNFQQVKLKVTGLTPLIQNKMKETIIQQMEDARKGKAKKAAKEAKEAAAKKTQ